MIDILFYFFAGLAVISSATILLTKNVLYAACALVVTFLSVAALYVLAGAEFLAITQIMIYVGGIVVLLIFGVMLTNKLKGKALVTSSHNPVIGVLVAVILFAGLYYTMDAIDFATVQTATPANNINTLGIGLMTNYILPFEVAAIVLLLGLIGASTIASNKTLDKDK
ncbi:MAG: NADH-quinone oxidoreductase subunit J [Fulvivirga sp.]